MNILETMKQALEALEKFKYLGYTATVKDEIANLRAAIEQMEKAEPVGHVVEWLDGSLIHAWELEPPPVGTPLYTHPAPAVPEGWQLVPKEPTEEMVKVCFALSGLSELPAIYYRSMLQAAPKPEDV